MIYSIFKDKVIRFPQAPAFVLEDGRVFTYAAADILVDQIAAHLSDQEITQGDLVGVMLEFESLHPFIFYALDKLNASYVPFDVNTPKYQLEVDVKKLKLAKFLENTILDCFGGLPPRNDDNTLHPRNDDIPVYYVASSGTSDAKKWMGIGGAGLGYWEKTEEIVLELKPGHRVLCTRSPAYDARISEYLRALISGGCLHLISRHERKDMDFIIQYCEKHQITELLLIASQLTGDDLEDKIARLAKAGLKNLIVTGDACSPRLQELCEKYEINLINAYGPTEATFGASVTKVNGLKLVNDKGQPVVPIGLPYGDEIKIHLLDGQVYIESPYLTLDYVDDPEKTAQMFKLIEIDGTIRRVFYTGDNAAIQNNMLIYKGRNENSHDSKVIGVKVDSFGIEQLIRHYSRQDNKFIQACVVSKSIDGHTKLVAYLVVKPDFDSMKFLDYLQGWLKAEEMPLLMTIDALPIMTVSDKIDRQALKAKTDQPGDYLLSRNNGTPIIHENKIIEKLEQIWESVLKIKPISHDDNFVLMGGDSISAIRMLKRIQEQIDPTFSHRDLFTLEPISINAIYLKLTQKSTTEQKESIALITPLTHPIEENKPNLFMLPPLLGDSKALRKLAESYAKDQDANIYGLSDPGIYDSSKVAKSIEEAADRYVKAILKIQSYGTYNLMGFSYGCILAYHVAKKLLALGHVVDGLHLVDGFSPIFYQKISHVQHANLLMDFSKFIAEILGNEFYNDPIIMTGMPFLPDKSKKDQINTLVNFFLSQVKNDLSICVLEVVRNHLLFLLKEEVPTMIDPYNARLYLSRPGQNFVSLISEIPGLTSSHPEHEFYYWNKYFDRITRCGDIAKCDHLALINHTKASQLFFQYTKMPSRLMSLVIESSFHDNFIYLFPHSENSYIIIVCNFFPGYENRFLAWFSQFVHCKNIRTIKQDAKFVIRNNPNDSLYHERYAVVAELPSDQLEALNIYLEANSAITEGKNLSPEAFVIDRNQPHTVCDITIKMIWENKELVNFFYEQIDIDASVLLSLYNEEYGNELSHYQEANHLTLVYNFLKPKSQADRHNGAFNEISRHMSVILPKIMPYVLAQNHPAEITYISHNTDIHGLKLSEIIDSFKASPVMMRNKRKCSIM